MKYILPLLFLLSFCYGNNTHDHVKELIKKHEEGSDWQKIKEELAKMGKKAVPFLLESGKDIYYSDLAYFLSYTGKESEELLLLAMDSKNEKHQEAAALALIHLRSEIAIPKLIKYSRKHTFGMAFASGLLEIGDKAHKAILDGLASNNREKRETSLRILKMTSPPPNFILPILKLIEEDPIPALRSMAIENFSYHEKQLDLIVPTLMKSLQDTDIKVQEEAVVTLFTIAKKLPSDHFLYALLEKALYSKNSVVRKNAILTLGRLNHLAIPFLPKILSSAQHSDPEVRKAVVQVLWWIDESGSVILPILASFLQDSDLSVRILALEMIGYMEKKAQLALDDLLLAFQSSTEVSFQKAVIKTLVKISPQSKKVKKAFKSSLQNQKSETQRAILSLLSQECLIDKDIIPLYIGSLSNNSPYQYLFYRVLEKARPGTEAIKEFKKGLSHQNIYVRINVSRLLLKFGTDATELVPVLAKIIKEASDIEQRLEACYVLQDMAEKAALAVDALILALDEKKLQWSAIYTLSKVGKLAAPATEKLIALLQNQNKKLAYKSAFALGSIGPKAKAAIPELLAKLKDDNHHLRRNCAGALGKIGSKDQEILKALDLSCQDQDSRTRVEAVLALGKLETSAITNISALKDALSSKIWEYRMQACQVATKLGSKAQSLDSKIKELALSDSVWNVKMEATIALPQISPKASKEFIFHIKNTSPLPSLGSYRNANGKEKRQMIAQVYTHYDYGYSCLLLKRYDLSIRLFKSCLEYLEGLDLSYAHYNIACGYSLRSVSKQENKKKKDIKLALSYLEKSVKLGYSEYAHMQQDPDLKPLHQELKYQEILQKLTAD